MKPPAFEYHRPATLDEALALLAAHEGDAKPLAGGQSLVPAMNFRLAQPAVLVDLGALNELSYVRETPDGGLAIGAMTTHAALERDAGVAARAPLLAETMPWIAHPQIRNRGTVGGSLAHADPAAELPAVMVVLGARFRVRGAAGERTVDAVDFFTGLFMTALEPAELLVGIDIPAPPARSGHAFLEFARRHGDFALVGAAAQVILDDTGTCTQARLGLVSVGDGPVLSASVAAALAGVAPTGQAIRAAATAVQQDIDPPADIHASADYRRRLAGVLTERALTRAAARAAGRPA